MRPLTLNYGNVYYANKTPRRAWRTLFRGRPDVIVIVEGGWAWRWLANGLRPGYRRYRARVGDQRGRTDVLVLVHRRNKRRRNPKPVRLSRGMRRIRSNHDRFAVVACFEHKDVGRVAVIGIHPSPGPKALAGDGSHPIAKQYAAAMSRLADLIESLRDKGYAVVVAGDVQVKESAPDKPWDPYETLVDAGLIVTVTKHLDLIAADTDLEVLKADVLAEAGPTTGADHPFLTARLARRGRGRKGVPGRR